MGEWTRAPEVSLKKSLESMRIGSCPETGPVPFSPGREHEDASPIREKEFEGCFKNR